MEKPIPKPECYGQMDRYRQDRCQNCDWYEECYDDSFIYVETVNGDGYRDT